MNNKHLPLGRVGQPVNKQPLRDSRPLNAVKLKVNPAIFVPPGRVNLAALKSTDWKRELSDFVHQHGHVRSNNFWQKASAETFRNRKDILFSTIDAVMKKDKNIHRLSQIKPRLLPRIFAIWDEKGISKRAQINYFNQMRWFWRVCGIRVDPIASYANFEGEFTINRNAEHDKSWSGNGVDFESIYRKMETIDPVGARLMLAMKTYGLRVKESLCMRPEESDGGDALHLSRGTKTGKPRAVKFKDFGDDALRAVLDELKGQVPKDCHLAWQQRSLKQAKDRIQYLARKVGLTKKDLGVTFHGLRHEFAIQMLEKLAGVTAPVRGGVAINYRQLSGVRRKISEALGHHRAKVTNAYYGSFQSLEREQLRKFEASWKRIEPVIPKVGDLLATLSIQNLYWIGLHAAGAGSKNQGYEFVLPPGLDADISGHVCKAIAEAVVQETGFDCTVIAWESMPELKQQVCEATAVPLFAAVSPMDYMKDQIQQQREVRKLQ